MLLTRYFPSRFEARQGGDEGNHIIGRPVVIGHETDLGFCREVIEPGALDKTNLSDVLLFTNHDTSKLPLARSRNNNAHSTMTLIVDDDGLLIDATLDTERNAESMALYSAVERGDMTGMSFMFTVDGEEWEDEETDSPLCHINAIGSIIEVSAVNFPAYPQTEISVRDKEALESVQRSLESARAAKALDSALEQQQKADLERAKLYAKLGVIR